MIPFGFQEGDELHGDGMGGLYVLRDGKRLPVTSQQPKLIHGRRFIDAMIESGLLPPYTVAVTIKASVSDVVTLDYQTFGDERLVNFAANLAETDDPIEARYP